MVAVVLDVLLMLLLQAWWWCGPRADVGMLVMWCLRGCSGGSAVVLVCVPGSDACVSVCVTVVRAWYWGVDVMVRLV